MGGIYPYWAVNPAEKLFRPEYVCASLPPVGTHLEDITLALETKMFFGVFEFRLGASPH